MKCIANEEKYKLNFTLLVLYLTKLPGLVPLVRVEALLGNGEDLGTRNHEIIVDNIEEGFIQILLNFLPRLLFCTRRFE